MRNKWAGARERPARDHTSERTCSMSKRNGSPKTSKPAAKPRMVYVIEQPEFVSECDKLILSIRAFRLAASVDNHHEIDRVRHHIMCYLCDQLLANVQELRRDVVENALVEGCDSVKNIHEMRRPSWEQQDAEGGVR
jgi:hypothetical protein